MSPPEENAAALENQNNPFLDGSDIMDLEYKYAFKEFEKSEEYLSFLYGATPKALRGRVVKPVRDSSKDPKIQRNESCPCGSGNKFKKCCINNKNE